jgi:hypothetical protein
MTEHGCTVWMVVSIEKVTSPRACTAHTGNGTDMVVSIETVTAQQGYTVMENGIGTRTVCNTVGMVPR